MIITAIILNYKNYIDVLSCIRSLEAQKLPNNHSLNILIIDNASGDDGTKRVQAEFPQYKYIYNEKNLGFSKGVNQGIRTSYEESDYFLLVNNDAELEENCCSELIKESQNEAITGPAIYYKGEPDIIWQGGGSFSRLKMNIVVPDKNKTLSDTSTASVDFISGCVMLLPKSAIRKLGGFDEAFYFYGEDLDLCLRAIKKDIPVKYVKVAKAYHNIKRAAESRTNSFVLDNLAFSFILLTRKHFPLHLPYAIVLFIFLYSPFRFYQIIKGGNSTKNIFAWIHGGWRAITTKL